MRHAWLIIAHNEFGILQRLVSMLDDARSDFFVHIDRKAASLPELQVEKGRLFLLPDRLDVRWGSVSQIQVELALLAYAAGQGQHDFYHIISGTTLPLKPFDEIDAYFSARSDKNILTGFGKDEPYQETLKMHRFNLFLRNYTSPKKALRTASQLLWRAAVAAQRILGIRIHTRQEFYKASNWLSLREDAAKYLIDNQKEILRKYRYSFCGDEFFVPSELMASALFCGTILNDGQYLKHDIQRSNASTFRLTDYPALAESGFLFARKFTA